MKSLASDALSLPCGEILQHLGSIEGQQFAYGDDGHCELGAARIRDAFGLTAEHDIHFVPTGTAANILGCLAMLRSPEDGIISPDDGHLLIHEKGATEMFGHTVIAATTTDGKLDPMALDRVIATREDGVKPRALYLANATDRGLAYTKDELATLVNYTKERGLYSFVDGARLAMALAREGGALSLQDFGGLDFDMFWVGGAKNGGLGGEALVVLNDELKQGFRARMRGLGALMSKSWVIGAQFERFFTEEDDGDLLWLRLARHANTQASTIREGLRGLENVELAFEGDGTGTNMLFPVLPIRVLERLQDEYHFYLPFGKVADEKRGRVRLVCSWDTAPDTATDFVEKVRQYS